jgi:hypothetical protein
MTCQAVWGEWTVDRRHPIPQLDGNVSI